MGSTFFKLYRRFMIACLVLGIVAVATVAVLYVLGAPLTHAFLLALWSGCFAIIIPGSSLLKMRSLARHIQDSPAADS